MKKKDYSKIRTYFKENLHIVIPMCITALLFNGLMCLIPVLEGRTIDSLNSMDFKIVKRYCIIFFSLVIFVQINRFCKRYLVRVFGNKMSLKMREVSLENLFSKDLNYFALNNTGDILNRNLSDIYDTTEGIRKMTTECFDTFVLLLGYITMMFISDWKLSLFSLPFIALSILASQYMKKIVYKRNKEYKEYLSKNKDITLTRLNNELNYRGFGCSDSYYEDYEASVKILKKKNLIALLFQSSLEPLYHCIGMCGLGIIVYFGGMKVINDTSGIYTIGALSAFITTYGLVAKKAGKVGKLFNAYQAFKVSWVRCRDYLVIPEDNTNDYQLEDNYLVVNNLSYQYNSGFKLSNISFKAKKGEIIGVCGRVRCGKTTLLRALSGLYQYEGSALLGLHEVKDFPYNPKQYITYCATDVALFSDTVKNNIVLNREGSLEKALKVSALDEDLEEIGGLDAMLSHTNANISGGQQRRLQMARALYPDCRLILLDDPFQSVNPALAEKMIDKLKGYKDSIVILVSNNRKILKEATKIVYINDNKSLFDTYDNLIIDKSFKELMEA
ncbi:MAG: ABC transporter transmembrane domain-containing protein [Anaeroplasmataceae bacterium]